MLSVGATRAIRSRTLRICGLSPTMSYVPRARAPRTSFVDMPFSKDTGIPGAPERPQWIYNVIRPMRSKIGRYMAITIPPITTPNNAIMTGSRSVSIPATAASTSSS